MLHGSETWHVRKENELALQSAEISMVRWMCNVKVKDRVPRKELRERLGIDDIILILQQNRLRWYGHVLRKEDTDWVKKCMDYEAPDQEVDLVSDIAIFVLKRDVKLQLTNQEVDQRGHGPRLCKKIAKHVI